MANLLDKASVLLTPTAYDVGSINAIKPEQSPFADVTFVRNTGGTRVGENGYISDEAVDVPRLNHLGEPHWLIEPSVTNFSTYSEDFSQSSWAKVNSVTVALNETIAPTGVNDGASIISNITSTGQRIRTNFNSTISEDYTFSMFVKKSDMDFIYLKFNNDGGAFLSHGAYFNISNGVIGTITDPSVTAKIEDYGNGWYRCQITQTCLATTVGARVEVLLSESDGSNLVVGDGTKKTFVFGAQIEEGLVATSYIETNGASVTRSKDVGISGGNSTMFNNTEGVFYAEIAALANDQVSETLTIASGTDALKDRVVIQYNTVSNQIQGTYRINNSNVGDTFFTVSDITQFHKVAFKYKTNDFALWIDGVEVATDTVGATTESINLSYITFGDEATIIRPFYGKVKCIATFKEALSDEELQCLTS